MCIAQDRTDLVLISVYIRPDERIGSVGGLRRILMERDATGRVLETTTIVVPASEYAETLQ
jgi:hypothetical protein